MRSEKCPNDQNSNVVRDFNSKKWQRGSNVVDHVCFQNSHDYDAVTVPLSIAHLPGAPDEARKVEPLSDISQGPINAGTKSATLDSLLSTKMKYRRTNRSALKVCDFARIAALLIAFIPCVLICVGWLADAKPLRNILFNETVSLPAALSFAFLILSISPAVLKIKSNLLRNVGRTMLASGLILGLVMIGDRICGGILQNSIAALGPIFPSIEVASYLTILSLAGLLLEFAGKKRPQIFQIIALCLGLPSLFLMIGYAFGISKNMELFCSASGCIAIQFFNHFVLAAVCGALFFARPMRALAHFFFLSSYGGRLIRLSVLGLITLLPISYGIYLLGRGEAPIIAPALAVLLEGVFVAAIVGGIIAYSVRKIEKIELEKLATEETLAELSAAVQEPSHKFKMLCLSCGKEYPDSLQYCPVDGVTLTRLNDKLGAGAIFAEKYEIVENLGSGGMSTVYRARHKFLEKEVAIKILRSNLSSDAVAIQRFQMEAKAVFDLNNQHLLGVYDFGVSPDGQAYIVMDYLEGESLAEYIEREKILNLPFVLAIFRDIASGLAHAHAHGVLHRDIKPSNIMLVRGDSRIIAKIVDFGLAKSYDGTDLRLTQTGEVFGSPLYMSPEQCQGLKLDQRSDLYSFGCLMYETLTGYAPILGNSAYETISLKFKVKPSEFDQHLHIPDWLSRLVFSMLSIDPARRPHSADQVARILTGQSKIA